jgi:hypothetical protein
MMCAVWKGHNANIFARKSLARELVQLLASARFFTTLSRHFGLPTVVQACICMPGSGKDPVAD